MEIFQYILEFIKEYKIASNEYSLLFHFKWFRCLIKNLMMKKLIRFLKNYFSESNKTTGDKLLLYTELIHILFESIDETVSDETLIYLNGGYSLDASFNKDMSINRAKYIFYNNEGSLNIIINVFNPVTMITPMKNSYIINIYKGKRTNKDKVTDVNLSMSNQYNEDNFPEQWKDVIDSIITDYMIYYVKKYLNTVWWAEQEK